MVCRRWGGAAPLASWIAGLGRPQDPGASEAMLAKRGWPVKEIAQRMHTDPKEIARRWDDVIYYVNLLTRNRITRRQPPRAS
jgi:hypothetical protein